MKVLIVGADDGFAIENYYAKYLAAEGWEVKRFAAQQIFRQYYNRHILHKVLFKAGLSKIYKTINKQLVSVTEDFKPDIIWIFKGMEIFPETLQWLKQKNIFLVNYNPDNPFVFTGKGSGNSNVTRSIHLYDLHFTYNQEIFSQLEKINPGHVNYLPFGFELNDNDYELCKSEPEIIKACFVGNPDAKRGAFINALGNKGVEVDVYGNNWSSFIDSPKISIHPEVRGLDFWKTLRRYRVQLNLVRIHSEDSHNMRTFEVPGVGGIMLAKDTTEHRTYFEDKSEAWFYQDVDSCMKAIDQIIHLDSSSAADARKRARERSLASGYRYKDRAKQVSDILKYWTSKQPVS